MRWLVVLTSSLLALGGAELGLRLLTKPSNLYGSFNTVPKWNAWRNELKFLERYGPDSDRDGEFTGFHPQLGWDLESAGDGVRGGRSVAPTPVIGTTRIVSLGDSYVFGTDVGATENFSAILNQDDSFEVLNMGVPGYGIDQSALKYHSVAAAYQPHVILFGIYVSDYERASLAFSYAAKPRFRLTREGITLERAMIPSPETEIKRIGDAFAGRLWLVELLRNAWRRLLTGRDVDAGYFRHMDDIVERILGRLQAAVPKSSRLIVIHIPRAEHFTQRDNYVDEMSIRLRQIYARLNLQVLNLEEAFVRDLSAQAAFKKFYVQRENRSAGHFSTVGHQFVAKLIRDQLDQPSSRKRAEM